MLQTLALLMALHSGVGGTLAQALGESKQEMFISPGRTYAMSIPPGWQVVQGKNPDETQFHPQGPGHPFFLVRRLVVPEGADPLQLALQAIDLRLGKLPRFQLLAKRRINMAGHVAASITGSYVLVGNLQFPRVVEETYVVAGGEAFMFHFECAQPAAAHYAGAISAIYQSFIARPAEATDGDELPAHEQLPEIENIPF